MPASRCRLALALVVTLPSAAVAQRAYLSPQVGMRLGGGWEDVLGQKYDVNEHVTIGAALGFRTDATGGIEIFYSGQPTTVRVIDTLLAKRDLDLGIHNFSLTGWREFGSSASAIRPVALGFAGVTWLTSDDADESETTFMLGGGGGIRIWSHDRRFGLRFDGRLTFSFLPGSSQVHCVLPGGCLFQWNEDVLIQTELAAGMMIGLGAAPRRVGP